MRIHKDTYTAHIKDKDKLIEMRKILDKIDLVLNNHYIETTDFLDPYERYLAISILNRFDNLKYLEFGGFEQSERKIYYIYPDYLDDIDLNDYIVGLRINGDLDDLTHKDFLGSILSLGVKRSKIGDIVVHKNFVDIIVKREISDFLLFNLEKVANRKIEVSELALEDLKEPKIEFTELKKFLPSLRLDVFLSSVYNLSRQNSINIIKSGNVKVNWEQTFKASKELGIGDTISTRGYGRSILYSIDGLSKKGRYSTTIRILI